VYSDELKRQLMLIIIQIHDMYNTTTTSSTDEDDEDSDNDAAL